MRPSSKLCSQLFKHGASRRHQLNAGFWGKKRPKNIKKILTEKKYELVMRKVYRLREETERSWKKENKPWPAPCIILTSSLTNYETQNDLF